MTPSSSPSAQAEERKDSEDDHNQSDEIDQAVHVSLRELPPVASPHTELFLNNNVPNAHGFTEPSGSGGVKADRERLPRPRWSGSGEPHTSEPESAKSLAIECLQQRRPRRARGQASDGPHPARARLRQFRRRHRTHPLTKRDTESGGEGRRLNSPAATDVR